MNNKGSAWTIILFAGILLTILVAGFILAFSSGVVSVFADDIIPELNSIGSLDSSTNISEYSAYTTTPINALVSSAPMIIGFIYVMALIFSVVFVFTYKQGLHPAWAGFYFAFMLLIIVVSIAMSNAYQDIYTGTDEIALELQSQTLMSYMMLHSPTILAVITIVSGIFLFTRREETFT